MSDEVFQQKLVTVEGASYSLLGDLTTKVELLSYAAHHNIEVPSGLSNPKQIKKLLQSTI